MPLVVEDGTGFVNADSYGSIEEANAYHADRGNLVWATLLDEQKEHLLRQAADYITFMFDKSFIGTKVFSNQALSFPRYSYDIRWQHLRDLNVPNAVKQAQFELALVANSQSLTQIVRGKKSVKIGSISVNYDDVPQSSKFFSALMRLTPFLKSGATNSNVVRLVRV